MKGFDDLYNLIQEKVEDPEILCMLELVSGGINELETEKENLEEAIQEIRYSKRRY